MKKLLVLSHVLPFPGSSGQQQRVKNKLKSLKSTFDITFVTFGDQSRKAEIEKHMSGFCEKVICLPSKYNKNNLTRAYYRGLASVNALATGLKPSNYIIGDLELTSENLSAVLNTDEFDCVLYEYWHAFKTVDFFQKRNIPCVLDMHNVLSQSYQIRQSEKVYLSKKWAKNQLRRYTSREEDAWREFDGIIAINKEEFEYVKTRVPGDCKVFYTPMGIDLGDWQFDWGPGVGPPKIGYYGGLSSEQNQQCALYTYREIMPLIWEKFPDAEFWIIGSNPPPGIRKLPDEDSRIKVTGFVEDVKSELQKMSVVVCPWKGKYGFRSRLVEVMALGIPLVTTVDAVYGMELENEKGVLLSANGELAKNALRILTDRAFAQNQSRLARLETERLYSFANTYDKLSVDLSKWVDDYAIATNR